MFTKDRERFLKSDWSLVIISVAALFAYLYYAVNYVVVLPYPGLSLTYVSDGWLISDSLQPDIKIDDVIVRIDDLTHGEFGKNPRIVLFEGYEPGDVIDEVEMSDGRIESIRMPEPTLGLRIRRLIATIWFFPFWAAGTSVLLFVRPRDVRWRLLIAFMYLTGFWAAIGPIANWQIAGSQLMVSVVTWMMVLTFLHLHLIVPSKIFKKRLRYVVFSIYFFTITCAILSVFLVLPTEMTILALVAAILVSITLLIYRTLAPTSTESDRMATRLMLAGIALAFGPGILILIVPGVAGFSVPGTVGLTLAFIALPVLPISYTYAIYKRQLGAVEFRTNRLLGWYSFILLAPTIFILFLLVGEQWITSSAGRTFYLFIVSIAFALVTPPLLKRFQSILNKLAYGTEYVPDDILRLFAREIPSALTRDALQELITQKITPSLLIRQSALYLVNDGKIERLYEDHVPESGIPGNRAEIDALLIDSGVYQSPVEGSEGKFDWVRLGLSLVTREEIKGIWLLGRRDPDDFYPRNDIDLLQTLTNQIAPVIENIELYEELQLHADSLAEEVASRTTELISEKDRTQAILDSAGEGIFFTDPLGTILYTNPAMARLSGYEPDAHIGESLDLWQADRNAPEQYRDLWEAIYDGRGWSGELQLRTRDGAVKDVNLTIAPIQSQDGQITGFVGVQSDISKLKEVDRLKSNIISSVSHELKTPLTTIKTYVMLLDKGKREKREGYLSVLNRETDRLTAIIEDFLDLSSLEAGEIRSRPQPIDTMSVVDEVIESCNARALTKNIRLSWQENGEVPRAIADSTQLEQILTNLVVNALNYTPNGGKVSLKAGNGYLDGELSVWVQVSDSGPGIMQDDLPFVFDRFFRGKAAEDSGAPGTGLGLTICRELVERNRGRIEVDSDPERGAIFTVWLPAEDILQPQEINELVAATVSSGQQ
jgi:PAS domain S-box-containing protein